MNVDLLQTTDGTIYTTMKEGTFTQKLFNNRPVKEEEPDIVEIITTLQGMVVAESIMSTNEPFDGFNIVMNKRHHFIPILKVEIVRHF